MLSRQWPQPTEALPIRHELDTVPFYPQEAYQCGPASLAMALAWSGIPVDPEAITPEVFTPSLKGSLQSAMISAARRRGRVAYPISGAEVMLEEVAAEPRTFMVSSVALRCGCRI